MNTEILSIIDTAVKIGLGALISGVATYSITKITFKHEKNKELLKRKLDSIESSAESINEYLVAFSNLIAAISGVQKKRQNSQTIDDKEGLAFIFDNDKIFCDSRKHMSSATTKLRLLGLVSIAEILRDLHELDGTIRNQVIFEKRLPTDEEIKNWSNSFSKAKNKFYRAMSNAYKVA